MTLQEENKKIIIYHLKNNGVYGFVRSKSNNDIRYKNIINALLNSLYPKIIIDSFTINFEIPYSILYTISRDIKIVGHFTNKFKNVINKNFKVETRKEKEYFKAFCKKYGIIPYDKNIDRFIEYHNQFYFGINNILIEYGLGINHSNTKTTPLYKIIYEYEKIANNINGIKRNWFENIKRYFKLKFTL